MRNLPSLQHNITNTVVLIVGLTGVLTVVLL